MADAGTILHASIPEYVYSALIYLCTNFGAFVRKWMIGLICRCTITNVGNYELRQFIVGSILCLHLDSDDLTPLGSSPSTIKGGNCKLTLS